jgi:hypothetical protein
VSFLLAAAATSSGPDATLITGVVLAVAAVVSALTPIVLARRRKKEDARAALSAAVVTSSDLTLAGWTTLNAALQREISRLQGVTEKMQARIDLLESEIAGLQKLALALRKPASDA